MISGNWNCNSGKIIFNCQEQQTIRIGLIALSVVVKCLLGLMAALEEVSN
jgi:hypothetical protein